MRERELRAQAVAEAAAEVAQRAELAAMATAPVAGRRRQPGVADSVAAKCRGGRAHGVRRTDGSCAPGRGRGVCPQSVVLREEREIAEAQASARRQATALRGVRGAGGVDWRGLSHAIPMGGASTAWSAGPAPEINGEAAHEPEPDRAAMADRTMESETVRRATMDRGRWTACASLCFRKSCSHPSTELRALISLARFPLGLMLWAPMPIPGRRDRRGSMLCRARRRRGCCRRTRRLPGGDAPAGNGYKGEAPEGETLLDSRERVAARWSAL